jgi:chemotaxis signal transduction protein
MISDSQIDRDLPDRSLMPPSGTGLALCLSIDSGQFYLPLDRLHHLAGYATLQGDAEDYFLGWLMLRGDWVPVSDLNRVVCDQPTPEHFGSRILVVRAGAESRTPYVGLLAAHVTDTVAIRSSEIPPLDLDTYLPMLYTLIPLGPADA